jgi:8-oxo-dGTP pyrophosphatase MutT (NUDIX family)
MVAEEQADKLAGHKPGTPPRLGAAAVILDGQARVLLVKHTYGRLNWELPGGAAERGESIVETVLREVREETGLDVEALHTTGIYYEPATDILHFVFLCRPRDGDFCAQPDQLEISHCAYWPPGDLPRPISDFTVRRIADAVSGVTMPTPGTVPPRRWFY